MKMHKFHFLSPYLGNGSMYFHETWYIHVIPGEDSLGKVLGMGSKVKGQRSHENTQISHFFSISRKWLDVIFMKHIVCMYYLTVMLWGNFWVMGSKVKGHSLG